MNPSPYRVIVVLDRMFGEKLEALPSGVPVWIVDSPLNRTAAQRAWARSPDANHLTGITIFKSPESTSPESALIGQLDSIDLHHGAYSADPPYSVLEVIGAEVTEGIRSALGQTGFTDVSSLQSGFRAVQPCSASVP